jgi:hypothetical protein
MDKEQAIEAMRQGHKVAHRHFTEEEWVKESDIGYEFEDGILCGKDEFWRWRSDDSWLSGWKIVN